MEIIRELVINKNIEDAWEIMGNQFGDIANWVSIAKSSKVGGNSMLEWEWNLPSIQTAHFS